MTFCSSRLTGSKNRIASPSLSMPINPVVPVGLLTAHRSAMARDASVCTSVFMLLPQNVQESVTICVFHLKYIIYI